MQKVFSMADIEKKVVELATKARDNKLTIEEMQGGTFTITNGGVFGSLMSTPIINIPQSAILGMHKIQERPMAVNGQVVIRPMMYLALSYDHRIIDGRESVSFLVRVKELLENPDQLMFGKDPVKKYDNQLRYAVNIINDYDGRAPLSAWLKDFFRVNKQMGSTDRKTVSEMVYGFYRLGHNEFASIEDRILCGISFSNNLPELKEYFNLADNSVPDSSPAPAKIIASANELIPPPQEKRGTLPDSFSSSKIFPWLHLLSEGMEKEAFASSFLTQPDLFLRVRPGKKGIVQDKLDESGINYNTYDDACIALPNSTKVDDLLEINMEAVVQDKSSQRTGAFLKEAVDLQQANGGTDRPSVWDSCAASGGKAIMAHDLIRNIELTVSDIRPTIIQNLRERFNEARITEYKSFVADLTDNNAEIPAAEVMM